MIQLFALEEFHAYTFQTFVPKREGSPTVSNDELTDPLPFLIRVSVLTPTTEFCTFACSPLDDTDNASVTSNR